MIAIISIGSVLDGKYKILGEVGHGGMSTVYLALNEKANKQWAVKEVRKNIVTDGEDMSFKQRRKLENMKFSLIREKDILRKLHHRYLPSIVDVIDGEDSIIIIMDYIEGNSLLHEIEEHGIQSQEDVIKWALQMCDVLSYLHSREPPVIHRDIKPANIMLKPDGDITVIDFGTAREYKDINKSDTIPYGTYAYAAPEQINDRKTDGRTDIYSLGATMYHLLTAQHPDVMKYSPAGIINSEVSEGIDEIIRKCMQYNPEDRYNSADEVRYSLENYEKYVPLYRKQQIGKLKVFILTVVCMLVFALISGFGYVAAENKKSSDYERILKNAGKYDDYYRAILTDSSRPEGYEELLRYVTDDNVMTKDEADILYQLQMGIEQENKEDNCTTRYVLEEFKKNNKKKYMEVCNDIGTAFIYYYDSDNVKDRYINASVWFKEAEEEYKTAKIYCNISECFKIINSFSGAKQEKISGVYEQYEKLWNIINHLEYEVELENDTDSKISTWMEIGRMINQYLSEFLTVTDAGDIKTFINGMKDRISKEKNPITSDQCEKCEEELNLILEKLKENT